MRLKDKIAIITGGANGIGKEMALLFAKEGAKVIAADMVELSYTEENIEGYILNVTDAEACATLTQYAKEKYGKIDVLVNNAGITRDALTHKMSDEMWNMVIDVNLKGVFNVTKTIGLDMMYAGSGSIINILSVVGEVGNVGQAN